MQNDTITPIFSKIKDEMISTWAYLDAFDEIYNTKDSNQIKILEETAPGFFGLTQSALLESAFSRIARLMDPPKSCGKDNLNFAKLCNYCSEEQAINISCEEFLKIQKEWEDGVYKGLRTHRNKVHSHNDFSTLSQAQKFITSKMCIEDVRLLKEIFEKLWSLLENINSIIFDSALLRPTYGDQNQQPTAFFPYLKVGLKVSNNGLESPDKLTRIT